MSVDVDPVEAAAFASAAQAARRSRVAIRELRSLTELAGFADLTARVWGRGSSQLAPDQLRALVGAGSYLVGAYDADERAEGELLGVCLGFWGRPAAAVLHSHIAGVSAHARGRAVGCALKLHQRAWCLGEGVRTVTWTFDPLIARNAYFNVAKLGASPTRYHVDYYGPMPDDLNGSDETDRVHARWALDSPEVAAACDGLAWAPPTASPDRIVVEVPPDVESLRRSDPERATAWRLRLRESLGGLLGGGARVVGFDRERCGYLVEPRGGE